MIWFRLGEWRWLIEGETYDSLREGTAPSREEAVQAALESIRQG